MNKEKMSGLILHAQLGIETEMRQLIPDAVNAWRMADEGDGKGCTKYSIGVTFTDDGNGAVKCKVKASVSTSVKSESETRIEGDDNQTEMAFDTEGTGTRTATEKPANAEVLALPAPKLALAEKSEHPDARGGTELT